MIPELNMVYASMRQLSKQAYYGSCLPMALSFWTDLLIGHRDFQDLLYWEGNRIWVAEGNFKILLISTTLSSWGQYMISSVLIVLVYLFALRETQVQKLPTKEASCPSKII